jgi:DNA repair photolyase
MLSVYYGGFLVAPAPLELSLNYCSHKCAYCFANLNKPTRRTELAQSTNLLADFHNRGTLAARLLQDGYPVVFSNKTDPFATSNYKQTIPLTELMIAQNVPIMWQTRGGKGIDDVLSIIPRSAFYISICQADDAIRKRIEPGAPTIQSRLDLAEKLLSLGHVVDIGINPLVPEWMPDPFSFLDQLYAIGIRHTSISPLHMNHKQVSKMTDREKESVGELILKNAQKRTPSVTDMAYVESACQHAKSLGMHVYSYLDADASYYYDAYREIYPRTFPMAQDFLNHCHETKQPGDLIFFDEWSDFLCGSLPAGKHKIEHYIGATRHDLARSQKFPKFMTYRQLLGLSWGDQGSKWQPTKCKAFAYIIDDDNNTIVDDNDLPVLVWCGSPGIDSWELTIEEVNNVRNSVRQEAARNC